MGSDVYVPDAYFDGIDSESYVEEVTTSVYEQTDWDFDVEGYPVFLNAGLRYE